MRRYEQEAPDRNHLAIVMSGVNFIDIAGTEVLAQEARKFQTRGGGLYLIRVKEGVLATLRRSACIENVGEGNIFQSKTEALRSVYNRLDHGRCLSCDRHVFVECVRRGRKEPTEDAA